MHYNDADSGKEEEEGEGKGDKKLDKKVRWVACMCVCVWCAANCIRGGCV